MERPQGIGALEELGGRPKNSNEILQYYNKNNDIALPSNAWF